MRISILIREATLQQLIEAKAPWLKAIDFTIGLLRRMERQNVKFPIPYKVAMDRLKEMRKLTQNKFRMDTLESNLDKLKGDDRTLNAIEAQEKRALPEPRSLAAFRQKFPDKADAAQALQGKIYLAKIAPALGVAPAEVEQLILKDIDAFNTAYNVIRPMLDKLKKEVDAKAPKNIAKKYKSRVKKASHAFPAQKRKDTPLYLMKDLVGCRIITENPKELVDASYNVQKNFNIARKKNLYTDKINNYNAINYQMVQGNLMFEFQLKTLVDDIEANISHDLIYAPEKAVVNLSDAEKELVGKVIKASTQLSMRQWKELMGIDMVTSKPLPTF
jgi:ppGpp synthetase/RelA/SpoT-type nucleotidyltranferase